MSQIIFTDHSARRGALVPMLKGIYGLLADNAKRTKTSELENIITWQHKMRQHLVDVHWRFITAVEDTQVVGVLFYRYQGADAFLELVAVAPRHQQAVVSGFLAKLALDTKAKDATFYNQSQGHIGGLPDLGLALGAWDA